MQVRPGRQEFVVLLDQQELPEIMDQPDLQARMATQDQQELPVKMVM